MSTKHTSARIERGVEATADTGELWIRPEFEPLFTGLGFEELARLGVNPVRVGPDGARHTSWFERGGRRFYLKVHSGIGWGEILKCWLQGKRAIVDARPEARALLKLERLGLPAARLAAFGVWGRNPARRRSFVLTESLDDTEDLGEFLARAPALAPAFRQRVARELGRLSGRLHAARIAHQDLYLTHFRLRRGAGGHLELFLIDLHRARFVRAGSRRWRLKDLGALRFSTRGLALTRGDCARFWRAYRGEVPAQPRRAEAKLRRRIELRARAIQARIARRGGAD